MSKTGGRTDSAHRPRAHHFAHPHGPEPSPTPTPDRVGEALAGMTVEQKAAQLLVAGIEGTEPGEDAVQAIQGYQVGGVILFGRNVESAEQLAALTNGLKELNGDYVPLFLCVDQEGGRVDRMPPEVTDLPSALDFGSIADPEARMDACFTLGQTLAAQCAAFGFNMDFAPSLDIWSNPDNTVIGDRAFGNDWEWTAFFGMSAVEGMEKQGDRDPRGEALPRATGTRRWTPTRRSPWWTRPWRICGRASWCPSTWFSPASSGESRLWSRLLPSWWPTSS